MAAEMTHLTYAVVLVLLYTLSVSAADDIKWPEYNQFCRDDAGPAYLDDDETFPNGGKYHDGSPAIAILQDGECAEPLKQACSDRPTKKTAYIEGPIACGDKGWYCRIRPDPENWPTENLLGDVNFGHCNTTDAFKGWGYDQDGHCHGSSKDNTYYWWMRDHWHRRYNGQLRCCCGWADDSSANPMYAGRIGNRCDYRRQVTESENISKCRDANEEDVNNKPHGLTYEKGCKEKYKSQIGTPIPEDDSICWEIQNFGAPGDDYSGDSGDDDEECDNVKNKKTCKKKDECSWDKTKRKCVETDDEKPTCEDINTKGKCKRVCTWNGNKKNGKCVETGDEKPRCEDSNSKSKCKKVKGCTWDRRENDCVEEDEEWKCADIKLKNDCREVEECDWKGRKKKCFEKK